MSVSSHSLRRRVTAVVVAAVLATSAVFGVTTFIYAYSLEDQLFRTALEKEIERQQKSWTRDGSLPVPALAYVKIYRGRAGLPADLAAQIGENREQVEYSGAQGRHYHIARFVLGDRRVNSGTEGSGTEAVAVAEVSRYLLVRPYRNAMIQFLTGLGLSIAVVMASLGLFLANRAMGPLNQLASDVADASVEVPVIHVESYPRNEIGVLAHALGHAFNRIRSFIAREQAFTRDVSHELRTPLAVIRGAAEVIAMRPDLLPPVVDALRRIESATVEMTSTLDLLLALARENKGKVGAIKPMMLLPMIENAVCSARDRYPNAQTRVAIEVSADATAIGEPTSLQLILNNLINNSFQHGAGGELLVKFKDQSLIITDSGPGLGDVTDPFSPFVKGNSSEGSGLGLDISRRLSEATGIAMSHKKGAGGGACFCIGFSNI